MTIQECIKSGKKYRRTTTDFGMHYGVIRNSPHGVEFIFSHDTRMDLSVEDILATDWEVEVIKKELSANDIRQAAFDSACAPDRPSHSGFIECLIRNLGLE